MNNSFYSRKIGRPECGINNYNKVTILNVRTVNVPQYLMNCDETYCPLKRTINPNTGMVSEVICRKEAGDINTDSGLYIITLYKRA